jgi:hypothetical protein
VASESALKNENIDVAEKLNKEKELKLLKDMNTFKAEDVSHCSVVTLKSN